MSNSKFQITSSEKSRKRSFSVWKTELYSEFQKRNHWDKREVYIK